MAITIAAVPSETPPDQPMPGIKVRDVLGMWAKRDGGDQETIRDRPEVLFVQWEAGLKQPPHFHSVDQFTLVVDGSVRVGKRQLKAGSIQFAGGYTPYGPLVTGEAGLTFMLIRAKTDPTSTPVPAPAHLRKGRKPRMQTVDVDFDHPKSAKIVGPYDDGLEISRQVLDAGRTFEFAAPQNCGGQVAVVVSGGITTDGRSYPTWSCIHGAAGDAPVELCTGRDGADLLVLRFPVPIAD